jgi:hypothetical protein
MSIEKRYEENDKSIGIVADRLDEGGFKLIAKYQESNESVRRFARPSDGKQVLLFVRWAGGGGLQIEHWEIFTEVSSSNVTAEYLAAFEEAIA